MEKEQKRVQSERAGFTVTKQQPSKSASALRNGNPSSAMSTSSQRLEKLEVSLDSRGEKCEELRELRSNLR